MQQLAPHIYPTRVVEEIDRARAREYALLATLLSGSPDTQMIGRLALLRGDATPLGMAHAALAGAADKSNEESASREYFDLFVGLGQGLLLPESFQHLGIERARRSEPEDHIAILCEIMAGLISGDITAPKGADRDFFEKHLAAWAARFFVDLEHAKSADFYASVGAFGRIFLNNEAEAYSFSA
jgi:TorA maturation chaperone TorD